MASRRTTRVLAQGESFAVFETTGDILESPVEALGFFYRDTRHLSQFEIAIAGEVPQFLNSYVSDDDTEVRANLTNPDLRGKDNLKLLPRDLIHLQRTWVLCGQQLFQQILIRNFASSTVKIALDFAIGADFKDTFEVRGITRKKHGDIEAPKISGTSIEYRYDGLDGIKRSTTISFSERPAKLTESSASFPLALKRDDSIEMEIRVEARQDHPRPNGKIIVPRSFGDALVQRRAEVSEVTSQFTRITSSNQLTNTLLERSLGDLAALTTATERGHYIMAGIPWFATLFGRDSIITALSVLPFFPEIGAGVLRTLASLQGTDN
ncbi:MAG TPA: glycogen debranching N-terminal domain-containing protein, partial [Candidatus Binataceae bacterium]|nr:glycogen debranching N-terminal domain-containing protein [Candidatus Binataceae bacterium]